MTSQEQIDSAQARVDQADRAVQELETRRTRSRIVAPQAGTVTSVVMNSGEVASVYRGVLALRSFSWVTWIP